MINNKKPILIKSGTGFYFSDHFLSLIKELNEGLHLTEFLISVFNV